MCHGILLIIHQPTCVVRRLISDTQSYPPRLYAPALMLPWVPLKYRTTASFFYTSYRHCLHARAFRRRCAAPPPPPILYYGAICDHLGIKRQLPPASTNHPSTDGGLGCAHLTTAQRLAMVSASIRPGEVYNFHTSSLPTATYSVDATASTRPKRGTHGPGGPPSVASSCFLWAPQQCKASEFGTVISLVD